MFELLDTLRRYAGHVLDVSGVGQHETAFRITAEMRGARLRAYHAADATGPALLIISAPFKRPYIWDLLPEVSVVRRCLGRSLRVYLLEWTIPSADDDSLGLTDYAHRLPQAALATIEHKAGRGPLVLAGHSLGGTFAAICASLAPELVQGLILVDAPLEFGRWGGPLARALAILPHAHAVRRAAGNLVPGSAIDLLCTAAAPEVFQGQRWSDLAASLPDPEALRTHMAVIRWTLDEFPLPRRLFEETLEQLYREDRFARGMLEIGGQRAGINRLRYPVLAVINPGGLIVPPESIRAALARVPDLPVHIVVYKGDRGPALQHVGPLVGRSAHNRLWPDILDWISDRA